MCIHENGLNLVLHLFHDPVTLKPYDSVKRSFKTAVKNAGITDFHFHEKVDFEFFFDKILKTFLERNKRSKKEGIQEYFFERISIDTFCDAA